MLWLLKDLDLFAVLLRAASLSFEALLLGGLLFHAFLALPAHAGELVRDAIRKTIRRAALALFIVELLSTANSAAMLAGNGALSWSGLATTAFFRANLAAALAAFLVYLCARRNTALAARVALVPGLVALLAAVATSHSISRIDNRTLLASLTALHHLGTAAWLGALPFLWIALRRADIPLAQTLTRRFSAHAIAGVSLIAASGIAMAYFFTGAWSGLYATSYGLLLLAKIYLFALMLTLGAANFFAARRMQSSPASLLARLRRFTEAEIGIGFTVLLVAASLTSQPAAVDVPQGRPTAADIARRMHPTLPRMHSPAFAQLAPPTSMAQAVEDAQYSAGSTSDAVDRAWSEYNHHWAGLIVLTAAALALLARRYRWAAHWPLVFVALAVFIVLRADPECWPLGPRPFWASFAEPDALQHRLYALLIVAFALFEWGVQTRRWTSTRAPLVFPALCAAGGALLLTHAHGLADAREELFAAMSHTPIALLGVTAGWSRWLELRLPPQQRPKAVTFLWPLCLLLVGLLLLNYREA